MLVPVNVNESGKAIKDRRQTAEDGGQKAEGGEQNIDDRGQKVRRQRFED